MASTCRSCGADIDWARHVNGGHMPVDRASADAPDGNLAVWRENGILWMRVLGKDEKPMDAEHRAKSHFAVCPDAAAWRNG